jgi:hypothetical protein
MQLSDRHRNADLSKFSVSVQNLIKERMIKILDLREHAPDYSTLPEVFTDLSPPLDRRSIWFMRKQNAIKTKAEKEIDLLLAGKGLPVAKPRKVKSA